MPLLLSLPTLLCHQILDDWLETKEWSYLDIAYCNRKRRHLLMQQFKLLGSCGISKSLDPSVLEWIDVRNIKVKYLQVSESMINFEGYLKVPLHLESVFDLCANEETYRKKGLTNVINQCTNLKQLHVSESLLSGIDANIFSELTLIDISSATENQLNNIVHHCTKLKTFICQSDNHAHCSHALLDIIVMNPLLEQLRLSGDKYLLSTIRHNCKHLRSVLLWVDNVTIRHVNKLIDECPLIEYFLIKLYHSFVKYDAKVKSLCIEGCDDDVDEWTHFVGCFRGLESIALQFMYQVHDCLMNVITTRYSRSLKKFSVQRCGLISVHSLQLLLLNCSELIELVLIHDLSNDEVLKIFCDEVPNKLKSLTFEQGNSVLFSTMIDVLNACQHLEFCTFINMPNEQYIYTKLLKEFKSLVENKVSISTGKKLSLTLE